MADSTNGSANDSANPWGDLYRANVAAITRLANDLDEPALAITVPGSP